MRSLVWDLSRSPGIWSLDRHESYDGDLSVMVTPPQGEEKLVVSHEKDGFHLDANRDDTYRKLGCFSTMDALVVAIRRCGAAQATINKTA